ncbi:uncharacterized protein LOC130890738 isoform X2 [Diorhabda carinulata]|uniref:uncharacterized protein LOC130890738 isoform X2 n=1 Tax=Diorhabda carinulata TaxID=1163345 RepID=UPI0025A05D87|nr:uncharacterized protein LOC130890738 isoform X2 [Diorhabda carinulata]
MSSLCMSPEEIDKSERICEKKTEKSYAKRYRWTGRGTQCYEGFTLYDNIHGSGTYFIDDGHYIYYDGLFYANKLEGYCQIFYSEHGTHFQGLFKDNKRFGPGVLTYSDGRQDVGIWDGFSLIRTGEAFHSLITCLANTNSGHLKLMKFRNLVNVSPTELDDVAKELLMCLGADDKVLEKSDELYNTNIKNRNSVFFNKSMYDEYYARKSSIIEVLIEESDSNILVELKPEDEKKELEMIQNKLDEFDKRLATIEKQIVKIGRDKDKIQRMLDLCNKCCLVDDKNESKAENNVSDSIKSEATTDSQQMDGIYSNISTITWNLGDVSIMSTFSEKRDDIDPNVNVDLGDELSDSDSCTCMDEMGIEDIVNLENKLDCISNEYAFYSIIANQLREKRNTLSHHLKIRETFKFSKVTPSNVLAWNNEPILMKILKHSFLLRRTEYMVNFNVSDLLSGLRQGYGPPGDIETACTQFFYQCYIGDNHSVINHLKTRHFGVNVSDALGNTGIFFATVRNRLDTIKILAQFGANTNQLNDECLTPLSLSVILYLSEKYQVDNYEKAFIPGTVVSEDDEKEGKIWYPSKSVLDVMNTRRGSVRFMTKKKTKNKSNSEEDVVNHSDYIFSTNFPCYKLEPIKAVSDYSILRFDSSGLSSALKIIEETIEILLENGAKPYSGKCPIPVFLMTLYTENARMVEKFLEYGADVNVLTDNEKLNALHIMASAKCVVENLEIFEILIKYGCNPNIKAEANHWEGIKNKLTTFVVEEFEDDEKNPLHTLCLRTDFHSDNCYYLETLAKVLVKSGIDVKETYLGQDALRLAMISGNVNLVRILVNLDIIDPYRFINILPLETMKKVLENVVHENVSPLNPVGEYENVADFIKKNLTIKQKSTKQEKQKQDVKSNNHIKLIKKNIQVMHKLEEFVGVQTRRKILERLALLFTEVLYDCAEADLLHKESIKPIALYVFPETFLKNLKILFNHGKIHEFRFDIGLIRDVIDFLLENCKFPPIKSKKQFQKQRSKNDVQYQSTGVPSAEEFLKSIENMDFRNKEIAKKRYNLFPPGLDDPKRYSVCIECFKPVNEFVCPVCQQIYFCTERCFQKHQKRKSDKHLCGINIFNRRSPSQMIIGLMDLFYLSHDQKNTSKKWSKYDMGENLLTGQREQASYGRTFTKTVDSDMRVHMDFEGKRSRRTSRVNKQVYSKAMRERWSDSEHEIKTRDQGAKKSRTGKKFKKLRKGDDSDGTDSFDNDVKSGKTKRGGRTKYEDENRKKIEKSEKNDFVGRVDKRVENKIQRDKSESKYKKPVAYNENVSKQVSTLDKKRYEKPLDMRQQANLRNVALLNKQGRSELDDNSRKLGLNNKNIAFATLHGKQDPEIPDNTLKFDHLPPKSIFFLEILSKLLPEVDLHEIIFPYICYENGHLYYLFKNSEYFCKNYSMN